MHFLPCGLHLKINLCCQIFRLWIDHWLCNTGSPIMTIFWDSKNSHCRRACVAPSGQQSEPNCQNGRGTLTLKKESVFSRQALSHKAFLWKASNPILALCNLKKMVVGLWHSKRNQCFEDKPCSLISFCHLQLQHPYFSQTMTVSGVEKRSPDEFTI